MHIIINTHIKKETRSDKRSLLERSEQFCVWWWRHNRKSELRRNHPRPGTSASDIPLVRRLGLTSQGSFVSGLCTPLRARGLLCTLLRRRSRFTVLIPNRWCGRGGVRYYNVLVRILYPRSLGNTELSNLACPYNRRCDRCLRHGMEVGLVLTQ